MPDEIKQGKPAAPSAARPVKISHEKGAQYRLYHADMAWGAISHHGNLQLDFCVERPPTATGVINPVHADGNPTGEQTFEGLGDQKYFNVVRDFQCGIVLSLAAAEQVHSVLTNYLAEANKHVKAAIEQIKQQK